MENCNDSQKCCSTNTDANTDCCTKVPPQKTGGVKKKLSITLFGLAIIMAISAAFKSGNLNADSAVATTQGTACGMPSIQDLKWLKTDKKVAYILLKGEDELQNRKLSELITTTVSELNESDGSADYLQLDSKDKNYQDLTEKANVKVIPSIAVLGRGCTSSLVHGNVNSTRLIKAYISASTPASSCTSSGTSSCCSKK